MLGARGRVVEGADRNMFHAKPVLTKSVKRVNPTDKAQDRA